VHSFRSLGGRGRFGGASTAADGTPAASVARGRGAVHGWSAHGVRVCVHLPDLSVLFAATLVEETQCSPLPVLPLLCLACSFQRDSSGRQSLNFFEPQAGQDNQRPKQKEKQYAVSLLSSFRCSLVAVGPLLCFSVGRLSCLRPARLGFVGLCGRCALLVPVPCPLCLPPPVFNTHSTVGNSMGRRRSVSSAGLSTTVAFGQYLSPAGLQQLRAYKYVSAPLSSIVDQKMTYFWEFVVNLMPMWLASVRTAHATHSNAVTAQCSDRQDFENPSCPRTTSPAPHGTRTWRTQGTHGGACLWVYDNAICFRPNLVRTQCKKL
jgi:hypothetical protein